MCYFDDVPYEIITNDNYNMLETMLEIAICMVLIPNFLTYRMMPALTYVGHWGSFFFNLKPAQIKVDKLI